MNCTCGGRWFSEDQSYIHIPDVSDLTKIVRKKEIALQEEDIGLTSLYYSEGRIFATKRKGGIIDIANDGTFRLLFDEKKELRDLVVYKSLLISSSGCGSFDGIRIFNVGMELEELKYISSQFVLPENIVWLEEGKSVLQIGGKDESVIKINVSDPAKAKRIKSAKTGIGLCEHFVREGNSIYVLGTAIESRQHTPVVCEIDVSGDIPELKSKHIIKEYKPKEICSDAARGIVKIGPYFLLATYSCSLGLVEIENYTNK
jgi:hypothetical protein